MKIQIEIEVPEGEFESLVGAERWLGNLIWDSLPNATSVHVEAESGSDEEREFYEGGGVTPDGKSV